MILPFLMFDVGRAEPKYAGTQGAAPSWIKYESGNNELLYVETKEDQVRTNIITFVFLLVFT